MNININNRLYKVDNVVYYGYNRLNVHNQRGKFFVKYKGKQVNLKNIPVLPKEDNDPVFDYVFEGGFQSYPCIAMDYWIKRWRLGYKK